MSIKRAVFTNTLYQIIGKVISAGCTLLTTVVLARYLGVLGFGELTKILTFTSAFYLVVDFGLNAVVLRQIHERENQEQLATLFWTRIGLALSTIIVALIITAFLPFDPRSAIGYTPLSKLGIIILLPTVLTQAIYVSANAWFQLKLRYDLSVLASSLGSLTTLIVAEILVLVGSSFLTILTSFLVGSCIMAFLAVYLTDRKRLMGLSSIHSSKQMIIETFPIGITLLFNLIYFRADTFILATFRPTVEVGIYGLAYRIFEFPLTLPTFFMNALYPILLAQKSHNSRVFFQLIIKSGLILGAFSVILVLGAFLLSPFIALIHPAFKDTIAPFQILTLSLPLFFLSSLCMWVLIALKKQTTLVWIYGGSMIVNIVLNLVFIPTYGYSAAAIITGVSEALVLVATGLASIKVLKELV